MTETFEKATDLVPSQLNEAIKTWSVYDGSNRLVSFYTADTDAVNGQTCLLTRYTYDGATSRILGSKEELSTWNSAWNI